MPQDISSRFNSMDPSSDSEDLSPPYPPKSYALSGKIMLSAIVILFFVVFFMVCLHLYARWYLLRARRRQLRNRHLRHHRRTHLVFYVDPSNPSSTLTSSNRGLDASVLKSLPVFVYSSKTHPDSLECAVCLSEFEDNETGRLLSKCNHSFHTDCIDMWFHAHSTCPLCRSPVEPVPAPENTAQVAISINEPERTEPGSSGSGLCSTCQHEESSSSSASVGARRKGLELVVPRRNVGFGDESGCDSPATQTPSFRSPMSRMLSFKRILSRDRKAGVSPSGTGATCSSGTELDIERGKEEAQQTQS